VSYYHYRYCCTLLLQALVEEEKTIKTDPSLDADERAAKQQDLSERRMKVLLLRSVPQRSASFFNRIVLQPLSFLHLCSIMQLQYSTSMHYCTNKSIVDVSAVR
jgi:hypothetical protein